MTVFNSVLDVGFDYGAQSSIAFVTTVIANAAGVEPVRNQEQARPRRTINLGNPNIDGDTHDTIRNFFVHARGRLNGFLFKDWQDYFATQESIPVDGSATQRLRKTYGSTDPFVRYITRPNASTVVIEKNTGSGWTPLTVTTDYTLDASTGVVTWVGTPLNAPTLVRWSGEFWIPVRFDRDDFPSQFLGYEEGSPPRRAYALGSLSVIELLDE